MKDINSSDKKDILLAALEERYSAMRIIRERVQVVSVWALGLMVATAGWLVQSNMPIKFEHKVLYVMVLGVSFWVLRFKYFNDLQKGFLSQQRVTIRIEKSLGLYTPGLFDDKNDTIFPIKWECAGDNDGNGKFFASTYLMLYVGIIILVLAILFQPDHVTHLHCLW